LSDEDAFLKAVRSDPESIEARLVYADWLDERGDARGEYLRLEVELQRIQSRLNALRPQFDRSWLGAVDFQQLRYEPAYHMNCELPLRSGRTITLQELDQQMTYIGLLAGVPNREMNDHTIADALREAQRFCVADARPHLIPPPLRDYFREPGDMQRITARFPDHVPDWLPMVRCIGSFKDVVKARDPNRDLSVLTVVWFQDEYALPILEPALSQLRELDWDSLATDTDL
jgi:uncharacterized protein (TIGR02996 family)